MGRHMATVSPSAFFKHLVPDCDPLPHPVYVLYGLVLHGVEVSAGVLQQGAEDEGEADSQVNIYGFDEAVGVRQGGAGTHHQSGHSQDCCNAWNNEVTVLFSQRESISKPSVTHPLSATLNKAFCLSAAELFCLF